jgi:hypothetical protein
MNILAMMSQDWYERGVAEGIFLRGVRDAAPDWVVYLDANTRAEIAVFAPRIPQAPTSFDSYRAVLAQRDPRFARDAGEKRRAAIRRRKRERS